MVGDTVNMVGDTVKKAKKGPIPLIPRIGPFRCGIPHARIRTADAHTPVNERGISSPPRECRNS